MGRELTISDQEAAEDTRHEKMVSLNEQFIKENKKLFKQNAKEFAKMRETLHDDVGGLSPALEDQIKTLKEVSDDAQMANSKGQKALLQRTQNTIAVLQTLEKTDTANKQVIGELLSTAKDQTGLLKKNISFIDAPISALTSAVTDTMAVAVGVLSESPIIALGIKAFGDAFSMIKQARQERKESRQQAIMEALKLNREDSMAAAEAFENVDAQFSDSSQAFAESVAKQDKMFTVQKQWHKDVSEDGTSTYSSSMQESGPLQVMAVDSQGNAIALGGAGGAGGEDGEALTEDQMRQFDGFEEATKLLESIEHDTRWNRKYNFLQMKVVSDGLTGIASWASKWFTKKRQEMIAARIKTFVDLAAGAIVETFSQEGTSLRGKLTEEGKTRNRWNKVFEKQASASENLFDQMTDQLGETYNIFKKWTAFPELFGDLRNQSEMQTEHLSNIHALLAEGPERKSPESEKLSMILDEMSDSTAANEETANVLNVIDARERFEQSRAEEERREALNLEKQKLEVMKRNAKAGVGPAEEDEKSFFENLLGNLDGGLGFGLGAMGGAALISALGMGLLLSALGAGLFVIGKGAIDYLKDHPGEYIDAALTGFAKLGDLVLDAGVWIGEVFGIDMTNFKADKRAEYARTVGLAIENWFTNMADAVNTWLGDILPESAQKLLGIGNFKRTDQRGEDIVFANDAMASVNEETGGTDMNFEAMSKGLTAVQIQDVMDSGKVKIEDGMIDYFDKYWEISPTSMKILEQMKEMKTKLDNGEITKAEMDAFRSTLSPDQLSALFKEAKKPYSGLQEIERNERAFMDGLVEQTDQAVRSTRANIERIETARAKREQKQQTQGPGIGAVVNAPRVNNNSSSNTNNSINIGSSPGNHDPSFVVSEDKALNF